MKRSILPVLTAAALPLVVHAQTKPPANWDAPLCKPVDREMVYEFTRTPAVKKVGPDRYEISFAVKGKCDVAVAVEDGTGRIVRHIAYGVLGSNAPVPFQKDVLEQTLSWDGKDEAGKYVKDPDKCRVRVSLGLNPTFDKIIGWHPQDTSSARNLAAICADKEGVYVLECLPYGGPQLRMYDHDGNYFRTIYPWDPQKLDRVLIPKRTLPDAKIWQDGRPPAGSRHVPLLSGYGATAPLDVVQTPTCMAVAAGKIGVYTKGGYGDTRRLLRLRTDGTTGGLSVEGPAFSDTALDRKCGGHSFTGQAHMIFSPDGKWIYVTGGLFRHAVQWRNGRLVAGYGESAPPFRWNAVHRFAWDAQGPVIDGRDAFFGEVSRDPKTAGADTDKDHLNGPQGLACDTAGRLYIADFGNNRIQVISPEGKFVQTVPVQEPQEIAVHPRTGEIYVLSFRKTGIGIPKGTITLRKFGPLSDPAERLSQDFPVVGEEYAGSIRLTPIMGLDGWAAEPRIWLVHKRGVVDIYADKGKKLELVKDFEQEVRRAGYTPHSMHGGHMGYIAVDPVRGHLYSGRGNLRRIDPEQGKTWQKVDTSQMPRARYGGIEEAVFGWDGLMYVRHLQYIARFNPDKFGSPIRLNAECELPFDYGDEKGGIDRKGEREPQLNGVISLPWAMGGPNGYNNGLGISPRSEVVALVENFQDFELYRKPSASNPTGYFDGNEFKRLLKDNENRFRPSKFPGRPWSHGNLVWRFGRSGKVAGVDAIPGLPRSSFGIRTDRDGNYFTGVGYHMNVNDKAHIGGSLAKFAQKGARLIRNFDTPVKLDNPPKRPPDFLGYGTGSRVWGLNMFWAAPGMDQLHFVDPAGTGYPCECYHCKFDTDLYGRSFLPRAYGYHVQVLDTNGNRICQVGRYGNPDQPSMKPGDTDIGLGQCSYLATVSDKWLYIADDSNLRIIRVKLGYHAEKRVTIGP